MPEEAERRIAFEAIRNVGRDAATVMIEIAGRWGRRRRIELECATVESAVRLCERLPPGRNADFEREWREAREFLRALYAPRNYPWAATTLVVINVIAFLVFFIRTKSWLGMAPQMLTVWGSNYGPLIVAGEWWRLVSSLFLHLNALHLLLNMWVLWNAGRLAERLFGHGVFLGLYFFAGIVSGLATVAWDPALNVVGSSGAIFGLLGALVASIIRPSHRTPSSFVRSHWLSLLLFTLFNLAAGFAQFGIANAAHVGGLTSGALLGALIAYPRHGDVGRRYRLRQVAGAAGAGVAVLLIALALTPGIGRPLGPAQRYWKSHQWFIAGEADNLREWQSLLLQAQAGSVSEDNLANAFETQILPFWTSASERTRAEPALPKDERAIAQDVNAYATTRSDWARAVIQAVRSPSSASASNVQYYLERTNKLAAHLERRTDEENAELVSRALVRSVMVARIRRAFSPNPPCVRSPLEPHATGSRDLDGDGPKHRESIACSAQAAFHTGDFRTLEQLFAKYPAAYSDPADGGADRYSILAGLDDLFQYGRIGPEETLVSLATWRHQYPDSIFPIIVEAAALSDWGWAARGYGFATSISQQQLQVFEYRNAMAEGALEDVEARSENDPLWYVLAVNVKMDLGETRGEIKRIFEDGIGKFPNFLPLYRAELRALMPRWGGSYEMVNEVIDEASERDASVGPEMYARLYWSYASLEGDDIDIFTDGMADWRRMSDGFAALLKGYPDSDYLLNGYAYMACRAGDSQKYQALKPQLRYRLSSTAWSDRYSVAECDKKYAVNGLEKGT
jgi:membrane associated rhomboid family serine protease